MNQDIIKYLEKNKKTIDDVIKKYLPEKLTKKDLEWIFGKPNYAYDLEAIQKSLVDPVWDLLNRGGKRWRPALLLLIAEAVGGDLEKIKDFVVISEVVHNGSLIVDDIEDRSEMRRGQPCSHLKFGVDVAVNAGNFMYFLPALSLIKNRSRFPEKLLIRAWEAYGEELINIHSGQGMDIVWHNGKASSDNLTEQQYLQMCAYKTGTLARLSARLAVILSGGSEELEKIMGKFAESIGIAFQIQDDILSASGKEFQEKKGYGDDITEGKRTLIVIETLSKANKQDREKLISILNSHTKEKGKISEALEIIRKYKAIDYCKNRAKEIIKSSWSEVDNSIKESDAKNKLKAFADYLIQREI